MNWLATCVLLLPLLLLSACERTQIRVAGIGHPEYPIEARIDGIEGTVLVEVEIGEGGKVILAKGSGPKPVLVRAAEQNASQWVFGPFPRRFRFPAHFEITYIFKLKGHATLVATEPPDVRRQAPDRIEISAPPVRANTYTPVPR